LNIEEGQGETGNLKLEIGFGLSGASAQSEIETVNREPLNYRISKIQHPVSNIQTPREFS